MIFTMSNYDVEIPDTIFVNDFTIIYKGKEEREGQIMEPVEEFKTSKDEFFRKLRYFKQQRFEMSNTNELFIHDDCSVASFKEFIESIRTKSISLNESNFQIYQKLSTKYQYYELQSVIEKFIQNRPDLQSLINQLSSSNQNILDSSQAEKEIDSVKEELISKHLDICLQNDNLMQLPISVLHRIFSSPKKVLKNHHLLYQFIKKMIEKYESNHSENQNSSKEKEDLQILIGSLNYNKMSEEEIEELLSKEYLSSVFIPSTAEDCKNQQKFEEIDEKLKKIESSYSERIQKLEKMQEEREKEMSEMLRKIQQQEEIINNYKMMFQAKNVEPNNLTKSMEPNSQSKSVESSNQSKTASPKTYQKDDQNQVNLINQKEQPKNSQKDDQNEKERSKSTQNVIQNEKEQVNKNGQREDVQSKQVQTSIEKVQTKSDNQTESIQKVSPKQTTQLTQPKETAEKHPKSKKEKPKKTSQKVKNFLTNEDEELDVSSSSLSSSTVSSSSSIDSLSSLQKEAKVTESPTSKKSDKLILSKSFQSEQFQGIFFELAKFHKGNINDKGIIITTGNRDEDAGTFSSLVDYGYNGVNYTSESDPNSFICFDFKTHKIAVSAYSIKSANQRIANFLVSWVLEGSNDKIDWINIDSHSNDRCLCSKSKSCTFNIQDKSAIDQRYRYIQLRMTGKSPRNNFVFTIANIEFFGKYYSS